MRVVAIVDNDLDASMVYAFLNRVVGRATNVEFADAHTDISQKRPFDLLLVFGSRAKNTYRIPVGPIRIIELPNFDADWTSAAIALAGRFIREGRNDLELSLKDGRLVAECLIPF